MDDGLEAARRRDREDPLAGLRERFHVPEGYYMDGNSLGPLSVDAERAVQQRLEEWRELGVNGWTDADPDWFHTGERLGDRLAPLVGAQEESVVVCNSTTTNVHTLVGTFLDQAQGDRVLVNELDFPTDHYAIRAQLRRRGLDPEEALVAVESRDGRTIETEDVVDAITEDVGLVFMPGVLYRSGQLFDMERIAEAAHDRGALVGFDLAHSIGVVPHELDEWGVDFAVWCSYKYLNAGPGAIAGLYVNERHFGITPELPGWWGHEKATQFEMRERFTPAESAGAFQIGTVPVLSAAPLAGSLDVFEETTIEAVREKSLALTGFLIDLVDERLPGCTVGTPREGRRRGGHVAVEHPAAERLSLALNDRDVVVDYRPPDVVRVCPAPLYTGFADVWQVIEEMRSVLDAEAHHEYEPSGGVT
jgi:kynureninase